MDWAYFDYRSASAQRRRIVFMRAGSTEFSAPFGYPDWGADPPEGSDYVRIPHGAISITSGGDSGFDKFLTGLEMTSTLKMVVDFGKFSRDRFGRPSTDLVEVAGWIREYVAVAAGSITIEDTVGDGADYTRTFDLLNVVTIYSDDGDATLPVENFKLRFQGVQRKLPTKKGKIWPGKTATTEYELYSLARAVLDEATMPDVCAWLQYNVAPKSDGTATATHNRYRYQYEHAWEDDDGELIGWIHAPVRTAIHYWKIRDLYGAIEQTAELILQKFCRNSATGVVFMRGAGGVYATPLDHVTFHKRVMDAGMTQGDALATGDLYFEGRTTINIDEDAGTGGSVAGGLLIAEADEKMTLNRARYSAWSFLSDSIGGHGAKGRTWQEGPNAFEVFIRPILSSRDGGFDLTLSDVVNMGFDKGDAPIDFEESFGVTANISAGVQHARGDDKAEHRVTLFGSENEQGGAIKLEFDNQPEVAARDDWAHFPTGFTNQDGATFDRAFAMRQSFPYKVWYFDSIAGSTRDVPILVHHEVSISNGEVPLSISSGGSSLPTDTATLYDVIDTEQKAKWLTDFVNAVRVVLATKQRLVALPVVTARMLLGIFGNDKITNYKMELKPGAVRLSDVGDEVRLGAASGGEHTAQAFANTDNVDISDLPGRTWIMKVSINDDTDRPTVELIGLKKVA